MNQSGRTVASRHKAFRDDIGDLLTRRPLPGPGLSQVDPFLFLNHHGPQVYPPNNRGLPFGPHPHRGFETVTFILSGSLAHLDSGGHQSIIKAGGVQWMTAGSGLIHAEVSPPEFKTSGGALEILQLWINLPARLKMVAPAYRGLQAEDIPALPLGAGAGTMNLISGSFADHTGPIRSITDVFMSTVELRQGCGVELPAPRGRSVFLYVVNGAGEIAGSPFERWELVRLENDGDFLSLRADEETLLLFGHADPTDEPVVAHGPFVMNTREEINQAIHDYQAGKFNGTGQLL